MKRVYGYRKSPEDARDKVADTAGLTILDSVDLRDGPMPLVFDQGQLGSCFPAGTLIRMEDGSERPIEDVRLGEYVATAEGRSGFVRQAMVRLEAAGLIKLSLWGYSALRLTAEHPVLTERGYVAAGELLTTDFVALPRYRSVLASQGLVTADLVTKKERLLKTGYRQMGALPGRADVAVKVSAIPETIMLDYEFGRLVGLFLAEGSTSSGKAIWTFGSHEEETLVAETVELLARLGVEAYVQHRPNNSINVICYGTAWARFWERLCGTGAGEKSMHHLLLASSDLFQAAIMEGWLAGDGYYQRRSDGTKTRMAGSTVSRKLALGIYDIAQHLGHRPVLRRQKGKVNKYAAHRRDFYEVEINSTESADNWRCRQTDSHVFRRIRAIEHEAFAGYVYNLSVDGDESYIAEGVGVHNCTANAVAACLQYDASLDLVTRRARRRSRLDVYYGERALEGELGQGDTGAYGRDGFKMAQQTGVLLESVWPYTDATGATVATWGGVDYNGPPPAGKRHKLTKPYALVPQDEAHIKAALSNQQLVAFGITLTESFEADPYLTSGVVPLPSGGVLGGHELVIVGYDASQPKYATVRNSWSSQWGGGAAGAGGYCLFPWSMILDPNQASDHRTIVRATA